MSPNVEEKLRRKGQHSELNLGAGVGISIAAAAALGYALSMKRER
jgi:pantoate kinase